ncbi:MAG TPA: hypothetical protein VN048_15290, partial [Verrucomicrobiae bacterium]|nr:hypothetical protein [Verrucomicrobiae bacterium]
MNELAIQESFEGVQWRQPNVHQGAVRFIPTAAVNGACGGAVNFLIALDHASIESQVLEHQREVIGYRPLTIKQETPLNPGAF